MPELLQLPLDGAATHLVAFMLAAKKAPIFFAYVVATKHTLALVFFKVFLAFFYSCTWIPVRVAKEVHRSSKMIYEKSNAKQS